MKNSRLKKLNVYETNIESRVVFEFNDIFPGTSIWLYAMRSDSISDLRDRFLLARKALKTSHHKKEQSPFGELAFVVFSIKPNHI
jgi:hypothetical protein